MKSRVLILATVSAGEMCTVPRPTPAMTATTRASSPTRPSTTGRRRRASSEPRWTECESTCTVASAQGRSSPSTQMVRSGDASFLAELPEIEEFFPTRRNVSKKVAYFATPGEVGATSLENRPGSFQSARDSTRPAPDQCLNENREDAPMTVALRKASNTIVIAAQLYRELAISASDLLRPSTYR